MFERSILSRRGILGGLLAMPAIIRTPGLLMPVRRVAIGAAMARLAPEVWDGDFIRHYARTNGFAKYTEPPPFLFGPNGFLEGDQGNGMAIQQGEVLDHETW